MGAMGKPAGELLLRAWRQPGGQPTDCDKVRVDEHDYDRSG
jgi:hypothetical protein